MRVHDRLIVHVQLIFRVRAKLIAWGTMLSEYFLREDYAVQTERFYFASSRIQHPVWKQWRNNANLRLDFFKKKRTWKIYFD